MSEHKRDMLDRRIEVGHTVLHAKRYGSDMAEMAVYRVLGFTDSGNLRVRRFRVRVGGPWQPEGATATIQRTDRSLIVDPYALSIFERRVTNAN